MNCLLDHRSDDPEALVGRLAAVRLDVRDQAPAVAVHLARALEAEVVDLLERRLRVVGLREELAESGVDLGSFEGRVALCSQRRLHRPLDRARVPGNG